MGYYLSANTADGSRLTGFRVGTNGSQNFLAAAVLSGYASGRFEHSDRIRGSWVQPMRGIAGMLPRCRTPGALRRPDPGRVLELARVRP